ncbi:MAG TPA: mycothiol system anti-sigma-R factor [Acidimicrobiales bacterium]|nr:mycothiol system anti-sigma-R factor [Acidimicrobiales bacterium]
MDEHDHNPGAGGATDRAAKRDCRDALDALYRYLDGELDDERRRTIHHHLERCSPCLEAFDFEAELKVVVAQRCRESVPESLRNRVADALAEASRTLRPEP